MKFIDLIILSFTNLKGNRLRTTLTVLGVGVGIAAILFLVSLGFGLQRLTIDRIVRSAALTTIDVSAGKSQILKLDDAQVEKIKRIPHVVIVSDNISLPGQVIFKNTTTDCLINGVDKNYFDLLGIKIAPEKFLFSQSTSQDEMPTTVISTGALKLFGLEKNQDFSNDQVSYNIFITGESGVTADTQKITRTFKVGGIVEDTSSVAYVPVEELKKAGIQTYTGLKVKVDDVTNINEVKETIGEYGFSASSIADMIDQIKSIFRIFQMILAGFGIIALLVASIGMFNTMTIALLERTRDIGVMKAIGAHRRDVRRMFITESSMIGFSGGVVGVVLGWLAGQMINFGINALASQAGGEAVTLFYIPWQFIVAIIVFAFLVGLITGIYPAQRAAKLNPLEALRYE